MFISSNASVHTSHKTRSIHMTTHCINTCNVSREASGVLCDFNQSGCFFRFSWKTQIRSFTVIRALRIQSCRVGWQNDIHVETGIYVWQIALQTRRKCLDVITFRDNLTGGGGGECRHLVSKLASFKAWMTGVCLLSVARTFMHTPKTGTFLVPIHPFT